MDCTLLFSCLFLFFISSLVYLLTSSTYFNASFLLFIPFILLQTIPSLLFCIKVFNTETVWIQETFCMQSRKQTLILISYIIFIPQFPYSKELGIQWAKIPTHCPLFSYGWTCRHDWSWTVCEPHQDELCEQQWWRNVANISSLSKKIIPWILTIYRSTSVFNNRDIWAMWQLLNYSLKYKLTCVFPQTECMYLYSCISICIALTILNAA